MKKLIIASALLSLIALPAIAGTRLYRTYKDTGKPCISTNLGTWCSPYLSPIVSDILWDYCEVIGGDQETYDYDRNPAPYCRDVRMDNGQMVNILRSKH